MAEFDVYAPETGEEYAGSVVFTEPVFLAISATEAKEMGKELLSLARFAEEQA